MVPQLSAGPKRDRSFRKAVMYFLIMHVSRHLRYYSLFSDKRFFSDQLFRCLMIEVSVPIRYDP